AAIGQDTHRETGGIRQRAEAEVGLTRRPTDGGGEGVQGTTSSFTTDGDNASQSRQPTLRLIVPAGVRVTVALTSHRLGFVPRVPRSAQRLIDMRLEPRPLPQPREPAVDVRPARLVDRQLRPAARRGTDGNVRHGEAVAVDIAVSRELFVEDRQRAFGE